MKAAAAIVLVALSGSRTMAEPCAAAAQLDGDDDVAARVAVELRRLGDASAAAPGCPALRAAVTRDRSGAIAVTIRDRANRIEGRVVGDELLAAVWIDSWLHDDVAAPVWAPRVVPVAPPSSVVPSAPRLDARAPAPPAAHDPFALAASYETGWSDDGSGWTGFSVAACARIGRACAGGRVRAASQPQILSADGLTGAARDDLAALAIATTSVQVGRMHVAPELGVGVGRFTTRRLDGCKPPPNCDPTDPSNPMCPMPPPTCTADTPGLYVGDGFRADTWTPRVAASLRIAVPLFDHVWLEGRAAAELAPGAHGPFVGPADANGATLTLPGEPTAIVVLGVGVRVGEP